MHTPHGFHLSQRVRGITSRLYGSTDTRTTDRLISLIGFIGPLLTIPQIQSVLATKSAEDLSFGTWFMYTLYSASFLAYGIIHKEKPLIITNAGWLVMNGIVVTTILLYG